MWRELKFAPSHHQWSGVEKALGAKLSSDQREAIVRLTSTPFTGYLSKAAAERASSKMIDAKDWLSDAKKESGRIAKLFISAAAPGKRDAIHAARAQVYARLDQMLKANGHIGPIDEIFTMLPVAVLMTIRDVDSLESKSRSAGGAWREWVAALNKLFEEHELPCGISKDLRVSAGFVHFLAAIQKLLPQEVREHMPTEVDVYPHAIAEAAYRATASEKLPKNSQ
jgi:hypothetical protein